MLSIGAIGAIRFSRVGSHLTLFVVRHPSSVVRALCSVLCAVCCRRQPLTALRLDLWLRSLLRDSDTDVPYASGDLAFVASFPDVFQTARTLARALTRRASSLAGVTDCVGRNGFRDAHDFPVSDFDLRSKVSDFKERAITGMQRKDIVGVVPDDSLPPARRALAGRLSAQTGLSNHRVLESWVTSVAKTVARYKRWLPWQVFAQELRETLLQQFQSPSSLSSSSSSSAYIKDGKGLPHGDVAAEAAAFAACELVAAWNGQEVRQRDGQGSWRD